MPIEVQVMMFCSLAFIGIGIWANTEWLIWEREHELDALEGSENSERWRWQRRYERHFSYI